MNYDSAKVILTSRPLFLSGQPVARLDKIEQCIEEWKRLPEYDYPPLESVSFFFSDSMDNKHERINPNEL